MVHYGGIKDGCILGLVQLVYHYNDVKIGAMASQITSLTNVYSTVYTGTDQRKHQSSASLAFVRGIHRWPVNSPHKWPVARKMFPFDDVIMCHMDMWLRYTLTLISSYTGNPACHSPSSVGTHTYSLNTWRNNNVVLTSKRRHFDVITSKWHRFDVITMSSLRHVSAGYIFGAYSRWR